ncbi:MAG: pyruvate carboxylase, partial [Planctomycetaceae bacterium]|nr:pyruvate carboxylase [Planctomycetaceae bacterium]
ICEAAICYSGDITDPQRTKYSLKYYVAMAKELERMGAHILAIKDMAGLCKPYAAELLVKTLREEVGLPIHFHTHDTAGIQASSILKGADVGLDIADAALAPMSGGTSQPNLNTLIEALRNTSHDPGLAAPHLDRLAEYWRAVREFYLPFESPALPAGSDLYRHEMPGGQYTNLYQQARALGLADRWPEVCQMYADVNQLFGDIVKVTPTSKAVGDMALFLIAQDMQALEVLTTEREIAYPQSVLDLLAGRMGQNPGGFPSDVQTKVLRGEQPVEGRAGEQLAAVDIDQIGDQIAPLLEQPPTRQDILSSLMYPQVFKDFATHRRLYIDTSMLPTPAFFYGLEPGEEIAVEIEKGKTLIIRFLTVGEPQPNGERSVFFEMNGQPREVVVVDKSLQQTESGGRKAEPGNPLHVGAAMPGMVVNVAVAPGDKVTRGQKLVTLEAMKMQTVIAAEQDGMIAEVLVTPGTQVEAKDLLVRFE